MTSDKVVDPRSFWEAKQNVTSMLYDYFLKEIKSGNKVIISQTEAAKKIKCSRQSVRRGLDLMLESRVIVFVKKSQQNNEYMVNPEFVWKGSGKYHDDGVRRFLRLMEGQESRKSKGEYNG